MGAAALDKCVPVAEGMVGTEATSDKGVVTVIGLDTSPCSNCPHKNAWVVMMTKYGDGSDTDNAAWEEMMSMPGHGENHSLLTRNDVCKADPWSQHEDHIHARGMRSYAALSLDMHRGKSIPIGSNTVTDISLSPPPRIYSCSAAGDHHAAAMALYVEASCWVVKDSHSVNDLSQDTTTPYDAIVNGCTFVGCTDLKAGVIYKMKCYNCVRRFKSTPKWLSIHQYTVSCHESCVTILCPKCRAGGVLLG
jgi:hypothetical protein